MSYIALTPVQYESPQERQLGKWAESYHCDHESSNVLHGRLAILYSRKFHQEKILFCHLVLIVGETLSKNFFIPPVNDLMIT